MRGECLFPDRLVFESCESLFLLRPRGESCSILFHRIRPSLATQSQLAGEARVIRFPYSWLASISLCLLCLCLNFSRARRSESVWLCCCFMDGLDVVAVTQSALSWDWVRKKPFLQTAAPTHFWLDSPARARILSDAPRPKIRKKWRLNSNADALCTRGIREIYMSKKCWQFITRAMRVLIKIFADRRARSWCGCCGD